MTVLCGQAHVDVLASVMTGPRGNGQADRLDTRGLGDHLNDIGELPGQSPRSEGNRPRRQVTLKEPVTNGCTVQ
jgi:hypothetical protein